MNHFAKLFIASASVLAVEGFTQAPVDSILRKPLVIGTKIETGQVVKGSRAAGDNNNPDGPDGYYISQIGVSLTQEVVVNERLMVRVGAGGVFYQVYPAVVNNFGSNLGIKFGPGITQAQAQYKFGEDINKPWGTVRAGYFAYKYNPDAKNLGEYLFRAGAYPTYIFTGGWSITDNALVKPQGIEFSLSHFDGALKQSFMLANERDFRPAGDFTPSYVMEYTQGPFQVGAGVAFYHLIPIKNRTTNPRSASTRYHVFNNLPAFGVYNPIDGDTARFAAGERIVAGEGDVTEISTALGYDGNRDSLFANYAPSTTGYYETKATKLMARASFNPQKLVSLDLLNPQDLKVYSEIALLGIKNYPGLYEKRTDRMPIMFGINLPTFKLLDVLSFEMEYFKSANPDDFSNQQLFQVPVYYSNFPNIDNTTNGSGGLASYPTGPNTSGYSLMLRENNMNRRDDWKWSLYAVKQVITGVSLRAQVANDHFRTQDANVPGYWTGPSLTRTPKDWYYVVSVNFGI